MSAADLPKPGDVVAGKYRIEKIVGEGGMGVVFAAHHLVLDRRVALKVLVVDAARRDEFVERFVREAQAAARLPSEHVVRVMDAGSLDNDLPFFVMEHLEGRNLAETLATDGPLPVADLADYALQILTGLSQAHAAGIVHRDLKPANLFLATVEDGRKIIKILDFGISKQESERAHWKQLTGKTILGTPAYMSPEQLRSSKSVDAGADIWSLGVSLYELSTGVLPFDGHDAGALFAAILEQTPPSVRTHRPELPPEFEAIVSCCLRRDRDARFTDVGAMAEALVPLGSGKWSHLLDGIARSLASSKRFAVGDAALVEAAMTAARRTAPPPPSSLSVVSVDVDSAVRAGNARVGATEPTKSSKRARRMTAGFVTMIAAIPLVLASAVTLHRTATEPRSPAVVSAPLVGTLASPAPPAPAPELLATPKPMTTASGPPAVPASASAVPSAHPPHAPAPAPGIALKRSKSRPSFLRSRD